MPVVVVVSQHEPGITALTTPHTLRDEMGRLEYARYARGIGYLIADEHLDTFRRHANRKGWRLTEPRPSTPTPGPVIANPLPECAHCAQPVARAAPPRYCPGCGQPWQARPAETRDADQRPRQTCQECGNVQRGTWPNCGRCGNVMPAPRRGTRIPALTIVRGGEPVPLGRAIADAMPDLATENR